MSGGVAPSAHPARAVRQGAEGGGEQGVGRKEYFSYKFDTLPHPGPPRWETGLQREARSTEPDAKVLEEIYTHEQAWPLPRVES